MLALTPQQQAKLIHKSRHESRRQAKRYAKEHGGTGRADELDELLASALANPEAVAGAAKLEAEAHRAARQAADDAARQERRIEAKIVAAAAAGRWSQAAALWLAHCEIAADVWAECADSEAELGAVDAYGDSPTADEVAAHVAADAVCWSAPLETVLEEIGGVIVSACYAAQHASAVAALERRAVPDGRWAVYEYYRKSLSGSGPGLTFAEEEEALAYRALLGDYSTSSYSAAVLDCEAGDD